MSCVVGDDDDVTADAVGNTSCVHCVHCAVCFVIVLANNDIELTLVGLQVGFHDFLTTGLGEVAGLRVQNLPLGMVCSNGVEAVGTADRSGGADGAFDNQNVSLCAVQVLSQPVASQFAFDVAVGADECVVHGSVCVDLTVSNDDGDASVLSFLQDGFPTCGLDGSQDDVVNTLLDGGTDSFDLDSVVVVAVDEHQVIAVLSGEDILIVLGVGGTPVRLVADLCETNNDLFSGSGSSLGCSGSSLSCSGSSLSCGGSGSSATSSQCNNQGQGQQHSNQLFHFVSSLS